MSKDLLKDAIADAKALRETAIANAKLALEEAFTPKIESMLSDQIVEEYEGDEEEDVVDETIDLDEETVQLTEEEDVEVDDEEDEDDLEEAVDLDEDIDSIIKELEEMEHGDEDEEEVVDEAIDFDLDSIIAELSEMEMDDEEEMVDDSSELEEAYNTIEELRGTLNEVNLLNAKLLYSLKLFKSNNMGDTQKASVIETFDRANSVREVKLIYTTISESLRGTTGSQKKAISEGLASKPIGSTKPTNQPIVESNGFSDRMRKLAGLL